MINALNQVLDFIFPPKCPFCRRILPQSMAFCGECTLPWTQTTGDLRFQTLDGLPCISTFWYQDTMATAIKRYKFSGAKHYAPYFAQLMASSLQGQEEFDCISWLPLSKLRQWQRGYNQAELLAKHLAKYLNYPTKDLLIKVKNNQPQTSLKTDRARRLNTQDVYRLKNSHIELSNSKILLVDDVVTTGSSLFSAEKVLKDAGASHVVGLTLARARK